MIDCADGLTDSIALVFVTLGMYAALATNASQGPRELMRRIVQLVAAKAGEAGYLYALCDDGTVWRRQDGIPQDEGVRR